MKFFFSRSKKSATTPDKEKPAGQPAAATAPPIESDDPGEPAPPNAATPELDASSDLGLILDPAEELNGILENSGTDSADQDDILYRRLLNGLYDGVLLVDSRGTVFCGNRRAEKFFGYSDDEFWSLSIESLIRGVNPKVLYKIRNHTDTGRFTVINAVCKRKDGTTFPSEIAINHIGLFNKDDMIFSIRNTERREKSRELQELRDDALRGAGTAIAVCDTEGLIKYANPAFIRLTETASDEEVLKRFMGDFFTSNEAVNALIRTPSQRGFWMGNLVILAASGAKQKNVLAMSNLAPARPGAANRLVVTLTPVPRSVVPSAEFQ